MVSLKHSGMIYVVLGESSRICPKVVKFLFCSDNPNVFTSIGELQRLVSRLYIRRVRLLPRFDVDVKRALDLYTVSPIKF